MTKICTKCGKEKNLELFSRDAQGKLKKKSRCKKCIHEYMTEWSERPGIKKRKREWSVSHIKSNPHVRLVYSARERSKRNGTVCDLDVADITIPDVCPVLGLVLERGNRHEHDRAPSLDRIFPSQGYVLGNVAVISYRANRLKNDASAEEHRKIASWILFGSRVPRERTEHPKKVIEGLLDGSRARARKLNLEFCLKPLDIFIPGVCPILGIPLVAGDGRGSRHNGSPTLDRVDPARGYVRENIAVISYRANRVKNDGTAEEHLKIAEWMDSMLVLAHLEKELEEVSV
jgi:hypothetical protein